MGIDKAQCCVSATPFHWSLFSTLRDFLVRLSSRGTGLYLAWFGDCVWWRELFLLDLDRHRPLVFCGWPVNGSVYLSVTCFCFSELFQ